MREKFNLIAELQKRSDELKGDKKLAMVGMGDFPGANNLMRLTMNTKHHSQAMTIDDPEFPFVYEDKQNVAGEYSSFYTKTDKEYEVIKICKKYEELLKGKCYCALYFLYCKDDDSYTVVERKEVENLTENFGFDYKNDFLDQCQVGEKIPKGTVLTSSTSYDEYGNASIGVNGRILYAVHPAVQDDAIIISESFAKRMVANNVTVKTIPIGDTAILLNLYGKGDDYQGLPNIGDRITNGIICATRNVTESRMFSDMRDASLRNINEQSDQVYYGNGEIIDINVYCNRKDIKVNRVNRQLLQYYNDARWFYTDVYKTCKSIMKSGSQNIDKEISRWMRKAINYLDTDAEWSFNDNVFNNMMVEILVRNKEPLNVGRKITGRAGNKTVICSIWPDADMPYLTTDVVQDEYGVKHPKGVQERVDLITNPLAIINRTIPMVLFENSLTFILDRARKHAVTLETTEEQKDFLFDILRMLNPKQTDELEVVYDGLSDSAKRRFIQDCISVDRNGLLITNNGLYTRWEPFDETRTLRDSIIAVYEKYGDILKPYHIFVPKPKWGRDIYIGTDYVGYQYIMDLKQSGEKGFSVRSSGAVSDESLPEKSNANKLSRAPYSSKPIRFGEYKIMLTLNLLNCGELLRATQTATSSDAWCSSQCNGWRVVKSE